MIFKHRGNLVDFEESETDCTTAVKPRLHDLTFAQYTTQFNANKFTLAKQELS